jgi:hypothetical protein
MKLIIELWQFALENKKWWMIPFFIVLLTLSAILYLGSGSVASPFIYSIF